MAKYPHVDIEQSLRHGLQGTQNEVSAATVAERSGDPGYAHSARAHQLALLLLLPGSAPESLASVQL